MLYIHLYARSIEMSYKLAVSRTYALSQRPTRCTCPKARGVFRGRNYVAPPILSVLAERRDAVQTHLDHGQTQILDTPGHFKLAIILFNLRDRRCVRRAV